jgi:hypothetical protein
MSGYIETLGNHDGGSIAGLPYQSFRSVIDEADFAAKARHTNASGKSRRAHLRRCEKAAKASNIQAPATL